MADNEGSDDNVFEEESTLVTEEGGGGSVEIDKSLFLLRIEFEFSQRFIFGIP